MYHWIIENLMGGCQNYTECEVLKGACGCQGFGDKAGGAAETGGALCGVAGYYIVFDK